MATVERDTGDRDAGASQTSPAAAHCRTGDAVCRTYLDRRRARRLGVLQPGRRANSLFLAAPTQIFAAIFTLAEDGELEPHLAISGIEFITRLCHRQRAGHRARLAMAQSEPASRRCRSPGSPGLYATPTIALAPLFILWFGIGIWSKVRGGDLLVLFPVTINTEAGLRTTSHRLIEMLRSFGASRARFS